MSEYRKKPVVIEAYCATTDSVFPEWLADAIEAGTVHVEPSGPIYITTLEGTMRADYGDWIIRGVKGELYPCKPDIFEATYEPATNAQPAQPSPLERLEAWIETSMRQAILGNWGEEWVARLRHYDQRTIVAEATAPTLAAAVDAALKKAEAQP